MKITMKTQTPLWSTDGGEISLWRGGKVFRIGTYIDDQLIFHPDGSMTPGSILIWEFYEDGEKDVMMFDEDGVLLSASLSSTRPDYLIQEFTDLIRKKAKLNTIVNVIRSVFIVTELGF